MSCRHRLVVAFAVHCSCVLPAPLAAQFPKVAYTLQAGSSLLDDCLACDRKPIEVAISGPLILERLPVRIVGELYQVSAIDISCSDCPGPLAYAVSGEGSHYRRDPETQTTTLTLSVDGTGGIILDSPSVAPPAPWPAIDVTVGEDGTRDPLHRYTLRILAAPEVERVPYELVRGSLEDRSGSILEIVCPPCRLAHPFIPLEGTFLVGLIDPVDDGFSAWRLDAIDLRSLLTDAEYAIHGSGTYQEGGDAEILKQMRLALEVNGRPLRELLGGPVPVKPGAAFPVIDMEVEETLMETLWYRLHLVARPTGSSLFRRGDANSDGDVNIADAVYHLLWRFAGGSAPSCLEAADSDASGLHNLTDAVFTLNYLFLGGPAPPAPGPSDCGVAPQPRFGCASQPPCGAGG